MNVEKALPLTFTAFCRPSKLKTFPAQAHNKFSFINGRASTLEAGSKPRVSGNILYKLATNIIKARGKRLKENMTTAILDLESVLTFSLLSA